MSNFSYYMIEPAPAKLNLFLHVLGRLDTGYHQLESLAVFLDLKDQVQLRPNTDFGLTITGSMAERLVAENKPSDTNLVTVAATKLSQLADKPLDFSLNLSKDIPVQAGLGGGSADAAACLRLLCRYWELDWHAPEVMQLALSLGADVPVCMHSKSQFMRGIGEDLEEIRLLEPHLLLTNPMKAVSTQAIFKRLNLQAGDTLTPPLKRELLSSDINNLLAKTHNDLQSTATALEPTISQSLENLRSCEGAQHVRMTGSGATCFALFTTAEQAENAANSLRHAFPDQWFRACTTSTHNDIEN